MKRIALGLMAASLLAVALPAAAQSYGPGAPSSYGSSYGGGYGDRGDDGYGRGDFRAQLERLSNRVRRDIDQGGLTQWQGRRLMGEIGGLRQLERRYRYSNGFLDRREQADLQARLERVKDEVRSFHGPRDYDRYGYGSQRYDNDEAYWNADRDDRGPRR